MKKILIVEPFFSNVLQEWNGYDTIDEILYSERNLYEVKQWIKRFNKYADVNYSVIVIPA